MIGPAEIEDILSDYADSLAKAGALPSAQAPTWPLCTAPRLGDQRRPGAFPEQGPGDASSPDPKV